ncbi:DUF4189 domain-containing protein [Conchiformibius steedae]|uniref:DUF4189 domain-containing protein n=1 Tax=Conchiformibius steedae TaxID=153493 RepID=UPI0026F11F11|nr:DUF4189 domain-containing protein [Conchiformibius steedae]
MKKYLFSFALALMAHGALACTPGVGGGPHGDPLCMGGVFEQQRLMQQQQSYSGGYGGTSSGYAPIEYWGAAAVSGDAYLGYSNQQLSATEAVNLALQRCGKKDCKIMMVYKNQYLAIATGKTPKGYTATYVSANTQREAELRAMRKCQADPITRNCRIYMIDKAFP